MFPLRGRGAFSRISLYRCSFEIYLFFFVYFGGRFYAPGSSGSSPDYVFVHLFSRVLPRSFFSRLRCSTRPTPPPHTSRSESTRPSIRLNATNCTLTGNKAGYEIDSVNNGDLMLGGGAVYLQSSSNASFKSCNFSENTGAVSRVE